MIDRKLWTLGKYYAVHTGWGEDTVRHRKLPGRTGVREMHQGQNSRFRQLVSLSADQVLNLTSLLRGINTNRGL